MLTWRRGSGGLGGPRFGRDRRSVPVEVVSLAPIVIGQAMSLMVRHGNSVVKRHKRERAKLPDTRKGTNWLRGTDRGMTTPQMQKPLALQGVFEWAILGSNQ